MLRTQIGRGVMGLVLVLAAAGSVAVQAQEQPPTKTPPPVPPQKPDAPAKTLTLDLGNDVKMELILIPAGEFLMGSPDTEEDRLRNVGPQHRVKLSKPFYIGKYEVTQKQWKAVMGNNPLEDDSSVPSSTSSPASNPSKFKGDDLPVVEVSWDDCQEFCRKLSQKTGQTVRLPTEAEWEYACRAGTTTRYSFGDADAVLDEYAWFSGNGGYQPHPVGQKKSNAWGLHDMHGNVREWCQDWAGKYSAEFQTDPAGPETRTERVRRGGAWHDPPGECRSAFRSKDRPGSRDSDTGFRPAAGTP